MNDFLDRKMAYTLIFLGFNFLFLIFYLNFANHFGNVRVSNGCFLLF